MAFIYLGVIIELLLTMAQIMYILLPIKNSVRFSIYIKIVYLIKFYASLINELKLKKLSIFKLI